MGKHGRDAERFWTQVSAGDGCWLWTGTTKPSSYGVFWLHGQCMNAQRAAYTLMVGPVARDLEVCHACDNPPCVRPDHLFVGTATENMQDASRKWRLIGRRKPGPTPEQWRAILARLTNGEAKRALAREFGITHQAILWQLQRYGPTGPTLPR